MAARIVALVRRRRTELESVLAGAPEAVARPRDELVRALMSLAEAMRNAKGELWPDPQTLADATREADAGWLAATRIDPAEERAQT
jgi:hypothetical protein